MSIDEQIAHLEQVVAVDTEIRSISEQINTEKSEIGGARTELEEIEQRLTVDRESVTEMDKTRVELVQEMRQMDKQIERSRERLQRARNEREVNAAERELDELRKLQRDRDDEIKKLAVLSEQARTSIEECEKRKEELSGKLAGSLEGVTRNLAELESKLEACKTRRKEVIEKLPSLIKRRYESLLTRRAVPIAKTHDGICGGCHIELAPMMFHQMMSRTAFEECPFCHRIIYYEPPPKSDEEGE